VGVQVVVEVVPRAVGGLLRPPEVVLVLAMVADERRVKRLQLVLELREAPLQEGEAPAQPALVSTRRAHRPASCSRISRASASPLGVSLQRTSPAVICARAPWAARRSTALQNVASSTGLTSAKNLASIRLGCATVVMVGSFRAR
jgi:hypothetical protein